MSVKNRTNRNQRDLEIDTIIHVSFYHNSAVFQAFYPKKLFKSLKSKERKKCFSPLKTNFYLYSFSSLLIHAPNAAPAAHKITQAT